MKNFGKIYKYINIIFGNRDRAQWMVEMDRWAYRLSGAPTETIIRKSTDSFQTDKTPIDQWTQFKDINEVKQIFYLVLFLQSKLLL
jgi:hypothetical protein